MYKQNHQWKALQHECDKYRKLLKRTKTDKLSDLVTICGRDMKKLYKLVNNITGSNKANPCHLQNQMKYLLGNLLTIS